MLVSATFILGMPATTRFVFDEPRNLPPAEKASKEKAIEGG
jgi:hypothetical protein